MSKKKILLSVTAIFLASILLYQLPAVQSRLFWRIEIAKTYLRGIIYPAQAIPTVVVTPQLASPTPAPTQTPTLVVAQATALPTATPLPDSVMLTIPGYEKQSINNCGPATLSMTLELYGWQGDQEDIASIIKPVPSDRNVNPEEMIFYVRNYAGWLNMDYRVNGNIDILKKLLAARYPVIVETTFTFPESYWPNDDRWAAHYLLLLGYDDTTQTFTVHDSFNGPEQTISYTQLEQDWEPFNYIFMFLYVPDQIPELQSILGKDWDPAVNRQNALEASLLATRNNPGNTFAWFNLGNNYLYFYEYTAAAQAFDQARNLGWPQRMLRYQFGPFIAYFHTSRLEDLFAMTDYALERTDNSEEALLWHGWGLYRQGDTNAAIEYWKRALKARPNYHDAEFALNSVR